MGLVPVGKDGMTYATVWFTLVFLPIFPIQRRLIQYVRNPNRPRDTKPQYRVFSTSNPILREVLTVYLRWYVIFPTLGLLPILFCYPQFWQWLTLPLPILPQPIYVTYDALAIVWAFLLFVKLTPKVK